MDITNVKVARQIIKDNLYMVLSTCENNTPWIAPVFFAADEDYNFYFISGKETLHSLQIEKNPNVAVVVFDSRLIPEEADGVYIEGVASHVPLTELPKVIMLVYQKRFPDPRTLAQHIHDAQDFLGGKPRRFYKIKPSRVFKLDKNNQSEVDRRVEISLADLKDMV